MPCQQYRMTMAAIVEQPPVTAERRQDVRWRMRLKLPGAIGAGQANVVIHDLSTAGMLIETKSQLKVGDSIAIALPEAEAATARVVWEDGPLCGCRFDQPMPQAAVNAARLRHPIADAAQPPVAFATAQEALPERLLRLRRAHGISRAALSVRTGFRKPTIWAWETGKTAPQRANLLVLAEVFGLTEHQLLFGADESPADETGGDFDGPTGKLYHDLEEARSRIAAMAGVEGSKVRISIEF